MVFLQEYPQFVHNHDHLHMDCIPYFTQSSERRAVMSLINFNKQCTFEGRNLQMPERTNSYSFSGSTIQNGSLNVAEQ